MLDWTNIIRGAFQLPDQKIQDWRAYRRSDADTAREALINFRTLLLNARVIHLSDDLVWAVTKLSFQLSPETLMDNALIARMPFPNTLFTWNSDVRTAAYESEGAPVLDPSPSDEMPAMVVSHVERGIKCVTDLSYHKKHLNIFPVVYWFDPELAMGHQQQSSLLMNDKVKLHSGSDFLPHVHFWLTTRVAQRYPEFAKQLATDKRFGSRIAPPSGALIITDTRIPTVKAVQGCLAGTAGNPRWFGALCALMNYPGTSKVMGGTRTPSDEPSERSDKPGRSTTWTLFIPRQKVISRLVRHLGHARKSTGQHDVAGFWTVSHKRGDPACNHEWPKEFTRRQVCLKCDGMRWWKNAFTRGKGPLRSVRKRKLDYSGVSIEQVKKDIENK